MSTGWCIWWTQCHHRQTPPPVAHHNIPLLVPEDHTSSPLLLTSFQMGKWEDSQSRSRHCSRDWPTCQYLLHRSRSDQLVSEKIILQIFWEIANISNTTYAPRPPSYVPQCPTLTREDQGGLRLLLKSMRRTWWTWNHLKESQGTWGLCSMKAGRKEIASEVTTLTPMQMRRTVL